MVEVTGLVRNGIAIVRRRRDCVSQIDLRARLSETSSVTQEGVIENVVRLASDMIYGFIHRYGANNMAQDRIIALAPSLRIIIYNAMLYQAEHVIYNGNGYLSPRKEDRDNAINVNAKQWLERTVPEIGTTILYVGV